MALLDSVDKAITIIHLLTNNQWGPDVAQFLSCRQGVPTRDKLRTWGDRTIVSDVSQLSMKRLTQSIHADLETFHSHKSLLSSLRESKYLFQIRCTEDGIAAVIELLPSLHRAVDNVFIATLVLSTVGRPMVKLHPLLRTLVDKKYELIVELDGGLEESQSIQNLPQTENESVTDELFRCRQAALDYVVLTSVHDEIGENRNLKNGWVVTHSSRSIDALSIVLVRSGGHEISLSLSRPRNAIAANPFTKYLRHKFLEHCSSTNPSGHGLLSSFLDYVIGSDR